MALVDSNYCFRFVDIGSLGKNCDSTIFEDTQLWKVLKDKKIDIPPPTKISGTDAILPYAFVGDEAFGLTINLLRPYGGKYLSPMKRIFNYRLFRARRYVECAYGILSNKWRIFHRPMNVSVEFATDIVKACCILHTFVRQR
ncbi:protein alp1-like [Plakobranchus ocellatus]|uniref:Protein alp1-like n=1 Tax=Plakobranchus ocellatus TaxID=259542 RepID=A0AAV3YDA3_9GAST|nr:protein alp1-like [Plakobranchus ocellatus]